MFRPAQLDPKREKFETYSGVGDEELGERRKLSEIQPNYGNVPYTIVGRQSSKSLVVRDGNRNCVLCAAPEIGVQTNETLEHHFMSYRTGIDQME